jgi:hypothetical protein
MAEFSDEGSVDIWMIIVGYQQFAWRSNTLVIDRNTLY